MTQSRHHNSRPQRLIVVMKSSKRKNIPTKTIRDLYYDRYPKRALSILQIGSILAQMPEVVRTNSKNSYPATWSLKEDLL